MVIDFHTHVFPDKIAERTINALASGTSNGKYYFNGTVNGLIEHMEDSNADICVNLPVLTSPTQFDNVSRFAMDINERFKDAKRRIISFGGIHPDCEDIEGKIRYLKDNGIKGVKIHPDYQFTVIDDARYIRILEVCKDYDMIVVTHSGIDGAYYYQKKLPEMCPPELVRKVIKKVKHSKFVLGHYGAHEQYEEVLSMLAGEDVYFDTAYTLTDINPELFKKILCKHGEDRVLFATDCPWQSIKENVEVLKSYKLTKETEDKILYKNAIKLLGI